MLLVVSFFSLNLLAETFQLGDVAPRGSPDGQLNAADSLLLQRMVMGDIAPTNDEVLLGDVAPLNNVDGVLNAGDMVVHQRALLGLLDLGAINISASQAEDIDITLLSVDSSTTGTLVVSGVSGSVSANAKVTIFNTSNNETTIVTSDNTGVFTVSINGNSNDVLNITITDESGNVSAGIAYAVGAIQIVTPTDSSVIDDNEVNIHGTFSGSNNAGIYVNGQLACITGNSFYVNNVPLQIGSNVLSATIVSSDGTVSSTQISVDGSVSNLFHVETTNDGCISDNLTVISFNPIPDSFTSQYDWDNDGVIDFNTGNTKNFTADFENDSVIDVVTASFYIPGLIENNYNDTGVYEAVFVLTDKQDITYTQTQYVIVQDKSELHLIFESIWQGMNSALAAGNRELALTFLSTDSHHLYGSLFDALIPFMAEIQADHSAIKPLSFGAVVTDYAILKVVDGNVRTHIINFKRNGDGLWKINSF